MGWGGRGALGRVIAAVALCASAVAIQAVAPPPARASTAPTGGLWTDYGGGPAHRGSSADAAPTPPLHTEWSAPLFDTEFSGPLVVGSEVYVVDSLADGAHLLGLRLNDGFVSFGIPLG